MRTFRCVVESRSATLRSRKSPPSPSNAASRHCARGRGGLRSCDSHPVRRAERIAGGEVDPELRAGFVAILAAGLTTMSGGDGAHEAETEAHARRFRAGGAAAGEALPDGGQIGRAETGAGVAHEDAMMFVIHGQRERDAATTRRVSESVVEQVGDGLIDALAVEQHPT